jgi:hypothetical protein
LAGLESAIVTKRHLLSIQIGWYPVSKDVGNVRNKDPKLCAPVELEEKTGKAVNKSAQKSKQFMANWLTQGNKKRKSENDEEPPKKNFKSEDDFKKDDANDIVDEAKEWHCLFCTYLNSLKVDICEMCAKSRQTVASGRTGSSQTDNDPNTTYDKSETENPPNTTPDDEDVQAVDEVHCPKCTLLNPVDLKVCSICGASLHKKAD